MTGSQAQDDCQSSIRRTHALVLLGIQENVGLRQQIKVFQLKSGFGGCVCLLPFSKQMGVSCLPPLTFKIRLVLLEVVLNGADPAKCFQAEEVDMHFCNRREDTFYF